MLRTAVREIRQAVQDAFPASVPGSIASIGLILVLAFLWQKYLGRNGKAVSDPEAVPSDP